MSQLRVSLRRLCSAQTSRIRCCVGNLPRQFHVAPGHHSYTTSSSPPIRDEQDAQKIIGQKMRKAWTQSSQFPDASQAKDFEHGKQVTVHGFLARRRVKHSKLVFADIQVDNGPSIQITSAFEEPGSPEHKVSTMLRMVPLYSPVSVTGAVVKLHGSPSEAVEGAKPVTDTFLHGVSRVDLNLDSIQPLNVFPKDIIVSDGVQFPPSARHLQIRFSKPLRSRLLARPKIGFQLRQTLENLGFTEVETPILFKSTPEGAREFLVPTRRANMAYALPQSPQQYKQILMASGVRSYYQFARCFRDEDLRADRQPEFTQLDLEMSFATGKDVMNTVETLISELPTALNAQFQVVNKGDDHYPIPRRDSASADNTGEGLGSRWPNLPTPFLRLAYQDAMSRFGSDKPDLRIPFEIKRVDQVLPAEFVSKITHLEKPVVEAFRFRPNLGEDGDLGPVSEFVDNFMKALPPALAKSADGAPVPLIYNSKKPLGGLSSLGYDGVEDLTNGALGLEDFQDLQDGDILVFQAREDKPFQGGSTALGTSRNLIYQQAVSRGLLPRDFDLKFLWVVDFPMFTPDNDADPGQGGHAGFSATHHPFTAPLTPADVELLATDPMKARADHYDLVVNGIELGGGSRRIHLAAMQEYVMREILKMDDKGVDQFAHLLEALRAGCPPHAGFALGFDRLVAVFTDTDSVRDVIAFPKSMKGEDLTVKSPSKITEEQLKTYHLARARKG
ncbi:tRNA synthetases class II-domain-containing protein [Bombardia bombarda]|uniref:tRNA synthetases class II-domain-containing protein n=1 Tax=Bombardia bombarda TaxID=252184 RepID=A0AA39WZV7_9PEZI|nr:tRNA synthetases class II-domain-containing protein [Bombardia bombarda]